MLVTRPVNRAPTGYFAFDALPRIVEQLLHAERDTVGLVVDLDDLDLHLLADVEHLGRVIDAPPRDVGDVQQAVDAAEVDERTVVGDVLDHAVDDLTLFEVLHQLLALLGAGLFQHGAAGDDDVAAAAIHLQDLERLRHVHQRADVADRTDVDLRARQERHGAVEIDGEAALDLAGDDAGDLLVALERLLELAPALLAARLVTRQDGFAERVLDALQIDLDGVADLDLGLPAGARELAQRDAAFGLRADVDDRKVLLDADDLALDDGAFRRAALGERFLEHCSEIFARRRSGTCGSGSHELSWSADGRLLVNERFERAGRKPCKRAFGTADASAARRITERSKRWFRFGRAVTNAVGAGSSSTTKARSAALPACSDGFDDVDGGPECGVYIQMRGIEQVRILRAFQGGGGPGRCRARPGAGCRPARLPR